MRTSPASSIHESWRLELFLKDEAHTASMGRFLREHGIKRVNLPNKQKGDDLLGLTTKLRQQVPGLDVCVHWSCKHQHRNRSMAQSVQRLAEAIKELGEEGSILVVSGGGKRLKQYETVQVLGQLQQQGLLARGCVHVAFNPYLTAEEETHEERLRLRQKLEAGAKGVYLQIGTDVSKLEDELAYLKSCLCDLHTSVQLHGSVLLPTRKLLASMAFRPWSGVVLEREFFSSVEAADALMVRLVKTYARLGIVPLIESTVDNTQDLRRVHSLLDIYDREARAHATAD